MTPEQIEQMKADREAGTEGPWWLGSDPSHYGTVSDVYGGFQGGASLPPLAVSVGGDAGLQELEANTRRIARVPALEAEVLRLREALTEARTDLMICADNVRDAAKTGPRWEGVADKLMARVAECDIALNGDAP